MATMISSNDVRNDSAAPDTTANRICGSVTSRNAVRRDAPRLRATFSWFASKLFSADSTTITTSGTASMLCASTSPESVLTSESFAYA